MPRAFTARRHGRFAAIALVLAACGGGGRSPAAPTPPPAPEPRFTLSGTVTTPWGERLGDVGVEAVAGGRVAGGGTTTSAGAYSIPTLAPGDYTVRAVKWGYDAPVQQIRIAADTRLDIAMDRGRVIIQGSVEEAPPCVAIPVIGARVEIVDGPDAGMFAIVADASGYRLAGVRWGVFRMRASSAGHAPVEAAMDVPAPGGAGAVFSRHFRLEGPTQCLGPSTAPR
jgi:hypothetical protein